VGKIMFNISFNELFIVGVLGVLLLKPKDFPVIIEKSKKLFHQALDLKDEIINGPYSLKKEIDEIQQDLFSNNKIITEEKEENKNV